MWHRIFLLAFAGALHDAHTGALGMPRSYDSEQEPRSRMCARVVASVRGTTAWRYGRGAARAGGKIQEASALPSATLAAAARWLPRRDSGDNWRPRVMATLVKTDHRLSRETASPAQARPGNPYANAAPLVVSSKPARFPNKSVTFVFRTRSRFLQARYFHAIIS